MNFLKKLATNKGEGSPGQVQGVQGFYNENGKPGEWFCPRRRKCAKHVEQLAAEICQGLQLQHEGRDKGRQKYWQICFTCPTSGDFFLKIYKIVVQYKLARSLQMTGSSIPGGVSGHGGDTGGLHQLELQEHRGHCQGSQIFHHILQIFRMMRKKF